MIEELRNRVSVEEFDYELLMNCLKEYKKPRNKVTRLLKSEVIIRVKKGLYVFGKKYRKGPVCHEALANLIYGPSYISLEYALQFYGMIPERVEVVTSMTTKRNRTFHTPVGHFSYHHLNLERYLIGVRFVTIDEYHHVLMATKEKSLADIVASVQAISNSEEMLEFLTENLRIDQEELKRLDVIALKEVSDAYKKKPVKLLKETIEELKYA